MPLCLRGSDYAVSGSTHRCGCCGLKIHSILVCNGHLFRSWLVKARADGFTPAMLPPYGKAKYDQYLGDFSSSDVAVCHSCQGKMDKELNPPKPRAEDDKEGGIHDHDSSEEQTTKINLPNKVLPLTG